MKDGEIKGREALSGAFLLILRDFFFSTLDTERGLRGFVVGFGGLRHPRVCPVLSF
jgi:hypothetical protein